MDVNISLESVHRSAQVKPGFQPLQPENAMDNPSMGKAIPSQTDRLSALENGADWMATANFLSNPMQA
jgi:hypothetical protein